MIAVAGLGFSSAARADSGSISFKVIKAGFIVGGSGGSGTLTFHGKRYGLSIGGISYGFTFGASETRFHGTVSNIHRPSDVSGVYAAGNVGDRAHQPERRGAIAHRLFGRRHRQRGLERPGDHGEVNGEVGAGFRYALSGVTLASLICPTGCGRACSRRHVSAAPHAFAASVSGRLRGGAFAQAAQSADLGGATPPDTAGAVRPRFHTWGAASRFSD